jgi:prevent-host-death family protein
MKTMTWNAETRCDEVVHEARSEDVVLIQNGRPVAVVMPIEDDDLEWLKVERSPEFIASIANAHEQVRCGECVTHEQLLAELGLAAE